MEVYNSEQDQVEALKAWWDKNGRSALMALVVFLLSVLGWQAWNDHREQVAQQASAQYEQVISLLQRDSAKAREAGQALIAAYPGSVYSMMTSLTLAKLAVAEQDLDAAAAHLTAAIEHGGQAELVQLARLRLARIEFAQGQQDKALATLLAGKSDATSDELRGDILLAQGKRNEARMAYTRALAAYEGLADKRELVQMKLDDLAESTPE